MSDDEFLKELSELKDVIRTLPENIRENKTLVEGLKNKLEQLQTLRQDYVLDTDRYFETEKEIEEMVKDSLYSDLKITARTELMAKDSKRMVLKSTQFIHKTIETLREVLENMSIVKESEELKKSTEDDIPMDEPVEKPENPFDDILLENENED